MSKVIPKSPVIDSFDISLYFFQLMKMEIFSISPFVSDEPCTVLWAIFPLDLPVLRLV